MSKIFDFYYGSPLLYVLILDTVNNILLYGLTCSFNIRPEPADLESLLSSLKSPTEEETAVSSKDKLSLK